MKNILFNIVLASLVLSTTTKTGLTWRINPAQQSNDWVNSVSCSGCNPYNGDTDCEKYLPVLCITHHRMFPQPSSLVCRNPSRPCWAGGIFTTTIPIKGASITTKSVGDEACKQQFGLDSKMASHHDAWGWSSFGYILTTWTGRAWTWIRDQRNGNCGSLWLWYCIS